MRLMICYVSKDKDLAIKIADYIDNCKFDNLEVIYMDKPLVGCANDWVIWSETNIKSADIIMQLWTDNTMESIDSNIQINNKVIRDELYLARSLSKQIIILDMVKSNYAEGYDIASKTISKTFINEINNDSLEIIKKQIEDRIYKIKNNIHPEYQITQHTIKSTYDSMGNVSDTFIGRDAELNEINSLFNSGKHLVVISGEGGIGKTEIVKNYARKYGNKDLICYKVCGDEHDLSLASVILSLEYDNELKEEDNKKSEYEKACIRIESLKQMDPRFLLIIDNFNSDFNTGENKKLINKLIDCINSKVLFTTRSNVDNKSIGFLKVETLSEENQVKLFYSASNLEESEENTSLILELARAISGHTMTLELAARIISKGRIELAELKDSLFNVKTKVYNEHTSEKMTINDHLIKLFEIADLSDIQKDILYSLSFISDIGITYKNLCNVFEKISDTDFEDDLDYLSDISLVKEANNKYYLHSLVSDLVFNEYKNGRNIIRDIICDEIINNNNPTINDSLMILNDKNTIFLHLYQRLKSFDDVDNINLLVTEEIGKSYRLLSYSSKAKNYFIESKDIREKLDKESPSIQTKKYLADIYLRLGDVGLLTKNNYLLSLEYALIVYDKNKTVDNKRMLSVCYERLGIVSSNIEDKKKYYKLLFDNSKEVVELSNTYENQRDLALAYGKLAKLALEEDKIEEAKKLYLEKYKMLKSICDKTNEVEYRTFLSAACLELAEIYENENKEKAKAVYLEAYELSKTAYYKLRTTKSACAYVNTTSILAEFISKYESYENAEKYYIECNEICSNYININKSILTINVNNSMLNIFYSNSLVLENKINEYFNEALSYKKDNDIENAKKYLLKAYNLSTNAKLLTDDCVSLVYITYELGLIYFEENNKEEAKKYLLESKTRIDNANESCAKLCIAELYVDELEKINEILRKIE